MKILVGMLLLAVPVFGEGQLSIESAFDNSENGRSYYIYDQKSLHVAAGLELFLPIFGHAYAGNAVKGILPAAISLGGAVTVATSLDEDGEIEEDKETRAGIGAIFVLASRVWGVWSAVKTANDYNHKPTVKKVGFEIVPKGGGEVGARVAIRF